MSNNNNNTSSDWNNEILGGLWKRKSAKGTDYLTGKIGDQKILIFKTKNKKNDKSPDYIIYEAQDQGGQSQTSAAPRRTAPKTNNNYRKTAPSRNDSNVAEDEVTEEELF